MRWLLLFAIGCTSQSLPASNTRLFQSDIDELILCTNGGFVMNVAVEAYVRAGHYSQDPSTDSTVTGVAIEGTTGTVAFHYRIDSGGLHADELGSAAWTEVGALDPPNGTPAGQCSNLEMRSWW